MPRTPSLKTLLQASIASACVLALAVGPLRLPARAAQIRTTYPPLVIASGAPPFVQHFNLLQGYGAQPGVATYQIYEPLYIVDNINFKEYPWLASGYTWSKDLTTLTFTIRHGVRWSDGQPFSARDVYYTFAVLARKYSSADTIGLWTKGGANEVSSVTMPTADRVALHFKTVDATRFGNWNGVADNSYILPEHIWARVKNPMAWTNPHPVGTGPFTEIRNFTQQSFELGRNPYYWQPGKPAFSAIRIVGFTSNDASNLALEAGQVDWSGTLVPHAEKVYDARNPQFHHFYAPDYAAEPVFVNTTRYPFNLVAFRKALSMAINRQALNQGANFGYAPPADITGIPSGISARWRDPSIPNTLAEYHPDRARTLLQHAGFRWQNGHLIDPRGHPVAFELLPTFNVAEAQVLAQNWKVIGIDVTVKTLQFANYFDRMQKGTFDVVDGWGFGAGPTTYPIYAGVLRASLSAPIGKVATQDFGRWTNAELEGLYTQFTHTADVKRQRALGYRMQHIFVDNLPVIPTVRAPIAENYNTTNYTGFPTPGHNYAYAQPFGFGPDTILMLTRIHPSH